MEIPIDMVPPSSPIDMVPLSSPIDMVSTPTSPPQGPLLLPCDEIDALSTISVSHQPIDDPIDNQKESVELHAIAKDFPNLMKFTASSTMLDLCIADALMPSPRFMQKMTQAEDIITPPSSIQFADEVLMQAGSPSLSTGVLQKPLQSVVHSPTTQTLAISAPTVSSLSETSSAVTQRASQSTVSLLQGAWASPLKNGSVFPVEYNLNPVVNGASPSSSHWPALSEVKSIGKNRLACVTPIDSSQPSAIPNPSRLAQSDVSNLLLKAPSRSQVEQKIRFPWTTKMNPNARNLFRATTPVYMEDGTPKVSIPDHVLLQGLENQREYVLGQFYRCSAPPGGLIHAVVNRLWGRKGRIFTRRLSESTYLFHIPDEATRTWVLQRGLWHVDDCLLFVASWTPAASLELPEITTVPVWVTLNNIPPHLYSISGIELIASGLGEPMLSNKPRLDPTLMGKAKIMVEVELDKAFPRRIAAEDKQGNISMVDVEYTWIPSSCERCGQLGHKASRCLLPSSQPSKAMTVFPSATTAAQELNEAAISIQSSGKVLAHSLPFQSSDQTSTDEPIADVRQLEDEQIDVVHTTNCPIQEATTDSEVILPNFDTNQATPQMTSPFLNVATEAEVELGSTPKDLSALPSTDFDSTTHMPTGYEVCNLNAFLDDASRENNESALLESREVDHVTDTIQDDTTTSRTMRGRLIKPSQKVQEMQWTLVGGRRNRGRGGRGGRGNIH